MAEPEIWKPAVGLDARAAASAARTDDMSQPTHKFIPHPIYNPGPWSAVPASHGNERASRPDSKPAVSPALPVIAERIVAKVLATTDVVPVTGPQRGSFSQDLPAGFIMPQPIKPVFPGLMRINDSNGGGAEAISTAFTKADLQSALSTNLAPKSGVLPSQTSPVGDRISSQTATPHVNAPPDVGRGDLNHSPSSTPPGTMNFTSTFDARPSLASTSTPLSGRKQNTYMLDDGSVVSGKGLGRGRPGVKRGPRKSKLGMEIRMDSATPATIERTATPPQHKRKRTDSLDSAVVAGPVTPSEPSSRASSIEYNPQSTQTRSGRQTIKPPTFVPDSTPVTKKSRLSDISIHSSKPTIFPKIKRRVYRGRENFALCEHCLRGNGPPGNVIVFCDACNKCWHQKCHDPTISEDVIKDSKAEWYCGECERVIHGAKKGAKKTPLKPKPVLTALPVPLVPRPLVGGSNLTRDQRQAQLSSLSKDKLIELIMRASDLAPALPLFEDPSPPPAPEATHVTPTKTGVTSMLDSYPTPTQEDDYEFFLDEHALLYPKPGNGVKLPPERLDLGMLLEGPECKTFSHHILTSAERQNLVRVAN